MYHQDCTSAFNLIQPCPLSPAVMAKISSFAESIRDYPAFSDCLSPDFQQISTLATDWRQKFDHVVICGTGGSSLGGQMLYQFADPAQMASPRLHFLNNVDPLTIDDLLGNLPLEKTGVISISKSGGTIETLLQTGLFIQTYEKAGLLPADFMAGVTENKPSALQALLDGQGIHTMVHPADTGGRYSVLSVVGLLPACLCGLDAASLLKGAAETLSHFMENPTESRPTQGAALAFSAFKQNKSVNVLMPYGDQLKLLGPWFVQLWAESLGKNGKGSTPVMATGSTDQHSVLQLLLDGPDDKLVTIITPDSRHQGKKTKLVQQNIPNDLCAGDLIYAQAHGTAQALIAKKRPVRLMEIKKLHEFALGELIMHFMLETIVSSFFLDVNAFDQPAVEDSKKRALDLLTQNQPLCVAV